MHRDSTDRRRAVAVERLRDGGGVVVALSGGVDSAVLLALALEALGPDRVLAATGRSAATAQTELDSACAVARALGARHMLIETREIERPDYRANAGDRCFHCRTELFEALEALARREGLDRVVYGAILDDEADFRPGMRAARDHRVGAPLLEAGLTKEDVRIIAAGLGLSVHDKPANPCLASRIPRGTPVTEARLARIERAEAALVGLGFRQFRVRDHDPVARLELDREGEKRIGAPEVRRAVIDAVRAAGFEFVALDLEGFRSGSLNPRGADQRTDPILDGGQ